MKYILVLFLTTLSFCTVRTTAQAQDTPRHAPIGHNRVNAYVGIFDANINYERSFGHNLWTTSLVRLGVGSGKFLVAGEGQYLNPAYVQLLGKGYSHFEIDLGIKYMLSNSIAEPELLETFIPDVFFGYRFEKPTGGVVLRLGVNYPTIINLGIGYKF